MFRKIIIGYDGSDQARDALALGRLLAENTGASMLLACVFNHELPSVAGWEEYEQGMRAEAERVLGEASAALESEVAVETRALSATSDARGLLQLAAAEDSDLIVVGSSHRGAIGRTFIGSVGERLLHGAPCPVAVAPRGFSERADRLRVVAAGFDGSDESRAALQAAADLAEAAGGTLRVIAVVQPQLFFGGYAATAGYNYKTLERDLREQLDKDLNDALAKLPTVVKATGKVLAGNPAQVLAAECEQGVDLLVMGSRGYGPLRIVLLGSVAASLMRSAPCPVMVIPRSATRTD